MDKRFELIPLQSTHKPDKTELIKVKPTELDDYLFTPGVETNAALPNSFNFSPHSHLLKELYDFSKEDFVYDQEKRDQSASSTKKTNSKIESTPSPIQTLVTLFSEKAHVEHGRTLYLDMDTNQIRATTINSGGVHTVEMPFLELWQQRKVPGLLIHTHPKSQMPSAIDYAPLLKDYLENSIRLLRGIMVLCPEIQILALATNKTPLLSPEKADEMIAMNNKLVADSFKKGFRILAEAIERGVKMPAELLKDYMQINISLLEELGARKITKEEFDSRDKESWTEYERKVQILESTGGTPEVIGRTARRVKHVLHHFGNAALVSFARNTDLRLYSSTDMAHFTEFSA